MESASDLRKGSSPPANEGFLLEYDNCDRGAACILHTKLGASYFSTNGCKPFQVGCDGACGRFLHPCCSKMLNHVSAFKIKKKSFSFKCENSV